MNKINLSHVELRSVSLKDEKDVGTIAEMKLHCRVSSQVHGTVERLGAQIGTGASLSIDIDKTQMELGVTDPEIAKSKKKKKK